MLGVPSGAFVRIARSWKSYETPLVSPVILARRTLVPTSFAFAHELHCAAPWLVSLYRYCQPPMPLPASGAVQANTTTPAPGSARKPAGAAGRASTTASTSISPVVRSPLPACPEASTFTLSLASVSKSIVLSYASVSTAWTAERLAAPLMLTPGGLLASSKSSLSSPDDT